MIAITDAAAWNTDAASCSWRQPGRFIQARGRLLAVVCRCLARPTAAEPGEPAAMLLQWR